MRKGAKRRIFDVVVADKDGIDKRAKIVLNKITPDNFDKLKGEVGNVYLSATDPEEEKIFVTVFFKKACLEEKYT